MDACARHFELIRTNFVCELVETFNVQSGTASCDSSAVGSVHARIYFVADNREIYANLFGVLFKRPSLCTQPGCKFVINFVD